MKILSKLTCVVVLFTFAILFISCNQNPKTASVKETTKKKEVTFIELGSVRCIPCKQMQPIMKSIEEKYGKQVEVVFYDVWTEAGSPYAQKYGISAIPTQVFLDENGKEYFRHEGFFPEVELIKVLNQKGVK
jgi:thioredoxin 1